MQEYSKIKVCSCDDAERFYRIVAIKGNPDLYTLGAYLGKTLEAFFEHMYLFRVGDIEYVADGWLENIFSDQRSLGEYTLNDIGPNFVYEYDTGEGWDFDCELLNDTYCLENEWYEKEGYPDCLVIEGKGQGIFENDHLSLRRYFDGKIDPESSEESDKNWQFLPVNMDFEKYGDFDKELNLEDYDCYQEEVEDIVDEMKGLSEDDYFDDDYDEDDEDEEDSERIIEMKVARDIFLDEDINQEYRRLVMKYDMDVVYEKILFALLKTLEDAEENEIGYEEVEERYLDRVKAID